MDRPGDLFVDAGFYGGARLQLLLFRPQCHLVSDKVGNFYGNKALVTFL